MALLLVLLTILSAAACSGAYTEETTETASTTVPETTETVIEVTTEEPEVSDVVPPDTTSAETTETITAETTAPPETAPPKATDTIRIIMQNGSGEAVLSGLAEEKYRTLLDAREKALLGEHSLVIELSKTDDLAQKVENLVLAGENDYDLLLTDPAVGAQMLCSGLLEDISGVGISITALPGINQSITESLSVGGKTCLFSSDALVSDIKSTYALRYNGKTLSSDPVGKVLSGDFTVELMLTYIKESDEAFAIAEGSPLILYRGLGGKIFSKTESGIPTSALNDTQTFTSVYTAACTLYAEDTGEDAIFRLEKLSSLNKGEIYLPIPRANTDSEYSLPIDHHTVSVFAAPSGVVSGNRLSSLVRALITTSYGYREGVRQEIIGQGHAEAEQMLDIFEVNASLDLGCILGWGDLDSLIREGIEQGKTADTLLSDRLTEMKNKAVDAAAKIVADRLGIN